MKIPQSFYNYILLFAVLLIAGLLLANTILVLLCVVPLLLLIAGGILKAPHNITIQRILPYYKGYIGDTLEVNISLHIASGMGTVLISDLLPQELQLVHGSNFMTLWKGLSPKSCTMTYTVQCVKAGVYPFQQILYEARHVFFDHAILVSLKEEQCVEFVPKIHTHTQMKSISGFSRFPMPLHAMSRMGIPTMDFKEIRLYHQGDSFKYINWKASARHIDREGFCPVVNEYEKEGKKLVWLFLDASEEMQTGSTLKSVFDYALEAIHQLSNFYLSQQCALTFCTYHARSLYIPSGMGKKQYLKLQNELFLWCDANKRAPASGKNLKQTFLDHRQHTLGLPPLFIIVTRITSSNYDTLKEGIQEIERHTQGLRGKHQILVIHITSYGLTAPSTTHKMAAELLIMKDDQLFSDLKKHCIFIHWDPTQNSLFDAIIKRVV